MTLFDLVLVTCFGTNSWACHVFRYRKQNNNKYTKATNEYYCSCFFFSVQVAFLFVHVDDATLLAAHSATVKLTCVAKFSNQLPHTTIYEWRKDGVKLNKSSSSLTIKYNNASDINNNYRCARLSSSRREVQCYAIYQCSASLVTGDGSPYIQSQGNATVTVTLSK